MNFGELKAAVETSMGRADIPAHVYQLATSDINTDLRVAEMLMDQTLDGAADVALTQELLEIASVSIDGRALLAEDIATMFSPGTGTPVRYAHTEVDGVQMLRLDPAPDAACTIAVRGYAPRAALGAETDENRVMTRYPGVYIYAACRHAAIWSQDTEAAAAYEAAYIAEVKRAHKADRDKRHAGPLVQRARVRC